jgi:hypothetical protein
MERVKQFEISNHALYNLGFTHGEIVLPVLSPTQKKIQQSEEQLLSNVSTAKVVLKMLTTKQNRSLDNPGKMWGNCI